MSKKRAGLTDAVIQAQLNLFTPAAADSNLGDVIYDLINNHNALLAHLDTGNVTGIGNANTATYAVKLPSQR